MNLFGFFSKKPPARKGSGTNILFRNHDPESKVLYVYNLMAKSLYDLTVLIIDKDKMEFRVTIEKISHRGTYEINLDKLADKNGVPVNMLLATISISYNNQLDKFRVNDVGQIIKHK